MKFAPDEEGIYYMHVYIVAGELATEVENSPVKVKIVFSEIHKNKLKEKEMNEEQLRLERLRLE